MKNDKQNPKAMWREEERKKRKQALIDEAKATSDAYNGPSSVEEEEAKSDWQRLIETAQIKFPAHLASRFNLTPIQRLCGVAHCIGWSVEKIALASGLHRSTVSKYLNHNDNLQEFIKAFDYHTGNKDAREILDKEQYNSLQVLRELRDDPSVSASTRKEISIWMFEMKHGKAKEHKEIKGISIRELTEELMKSRDAELPILEEEKSDERRDN